MSLRINLDNKVYRNAWEHLKNATDSKNKSVITAINQLCEPYIKITGIIRKIIRERSQNLSVIKTKSAQLTETLCEEKICY